jgi:hypothetical protein
MIKWRRMRWAGHISRMVEKRDMCSLLVGKPERKRAVGRPRRKWVDNIKLDLGEVGWGGVDWIGLVLHKKGTSGELLLKGVLNLQVP